jgi:hypothetical protein
MVQVLLSEVDGQDAVVLGKGGAGASEAAGRSPAAGGEHAAAAPGEQPGREADR